MTKISSGLRTLFLVHLVIGLVFGLAYLFIPGITMGWMGVSLKDEFPSKAWWGAHPGFFPLVLGIPIRLPNGKG